MSGSRTPATAAGGHSEQIGMTPDDRQEKMAAIASAVAKGQYRYTVHGAQQRIARGIRRDELEQAIASGEIIEDYPTHHYGPACLVDRRVSPLGIHVGK